MSEAPAEMWLRQSGDGRWFNTIRPDEPDAVRYVRADVFADLLDHYEALQARLAVERSWNEAPCLEPLP